MKLNTARFISSALDLDKCPKFQDSKGNFFPEVALIGRSNVGKSTLLNHLFQIKGLARTSSIPGKTQLLNFFSTDDPIIFVDLPGYGYAKAPLAMKEKWSKSIENYLTERSQLKLFLFLIDVRRTLTREDLQMLEWVEYRKLSLIFIFTKSDKASFSERKRQQFLFQSSLKNYSYIKTAPFVYYSAIKNEGRSHLIAEMNKVLTS